MSIRIRRIRCRDYIRAGNVVKRAISAFDSSIYPKKLVDSWCRKYSPSNFRKKSREITYFVAEETKTKKLLGIIGLKGSELRTFYVDPLFQGKGIGRMLFNRLEQEARKHGFKTVLVEGGAFGEPIYSHFGFKKIKTIEKEREALKYTDALMKKRL